MARLLALEWGLREARVVVARTRGDEVVIEHAFAIDLGLRDPGQTFADESVGSKIAAELNARKLGRIETLVAVGRASIELRQLTLPPSPPEELPDLVRFQALRQFTTIGEEWLIDFVPLDSGEEESTSVLAAAISPEMVSQITQTCQIANLVPSHLVLRPFAAASLLRRCDASPSTTCRLMVDLLVDEADLTVLVDSSVVLMRTVRLSASDDATVQSRALLGEMRRTIASAQNQLRGRRIEKVILCGDGTDQTVLKQAVDHEFSLSVELFDPFQKFPLDTQAGATRPAHAGRFAPLLGMLLDEATGAAHPIDFLHPRKRPEPPSQKRRIVVLASSVAAILLLVAGGIWWSLRNLDGALAAAKAESTELAKEVEGANVSIAQAKVIEQFVAGDITWLDELYALSQELPPPEDVILTQLNLSTRQPRGAQIVLDGYTRDSSQFNALRESLRREGRSVISTGTQDDARRKDYHWRFKETVLLDKTISLPPLDPQATPAPGDAATEPSASVDVPTPETEGQP